MGKAGRGEEKGNKTARAGRSFWVCLWSGRPSGAANWRGGGSHWQQHPCVAKYHARLKLQGISRYLQHLIRYFLEEIATAANCEKSVHLGHTVHQRGRRRFLDGVTWSPIPDSARASIRSRSSHRTAPHVLDWRMRAAEGPPARGPFLVHCGRRRRCELDDAAGYRQSSLGAPQVLSPRPTTLPVASCQGGANGTSGKPPRPDSDQRPPSGASSASTPSGGLFPRVSRQLRSFWVSNAHAPRENC